MAKQLSKNFSREEFERGATMPDECVPSYSALSQMILEPIRAHFGRELVITSGYRSPQTNAQAHGVSNSQHMATATFCAADFFLGSMKMDMRPVFDWIRLQSGLPFDQVTLEHGVNGDVIHISWTSTPPRREALEGATHNQTKYSSWPVNAGGAENA